MAIVSCSACQKKLKVADASLGKKVKCSCGNVFVAEETNAPAVGLSESGTDKVIVACTECGSKLKVAPAFLGKKMKCPKCAAVFIASVPAEAAKPVIVATPVEEDDLMVFAQADAREDDAPPPPKKSKAPPPMIEEDEEDEWTPKSRSTPTPARTDEPKKYPSRVLATLFVFFMLSLFIAFFAGVYLFMEDESMIDPPKTNRKYLEGFGWPPKEQKKPAIGQPGPDGGGRPKGKRKDENKVIAGDGDKKDKVVDGALDKNKDAEPKVRDDATKDEKIGAAVAPVWRPRAWRAELRKEPVESLRFSLRQPAPYGARLA